MSETDRQLSLVAERQYGLISVADARLLGLSRGQIQWRHDRGSWIRVARGVYRVAGVPSSWEQVALAACLAAPEAAVASHLTAAAVHGLGLAPPRPHVTVPLGRSHDHPFAIVHRARLGPVEVERRRAIPVTTPSRTLIDCAAILGPRRLGQLVDSAFHQRKVTGASIQQAWDLARRGPGRHGERRLRAVAEPWAGPIRPDSPPEARLRMLLTQWGYPAPMLQVRIRDLRGAVIGRADLAWPDRRVGIEYDSGEHHGPERWAHDLARQATIEKLGWCLLRADLADLMPGERALRDALARAWTRPAWVRPA